MQVLLIDDSTIIRRILSRTVTALGFQTREARNGGEALQMLEDSDAAEIGLVLLDWNMPGMSGLTFLETIRANARFQSLPVLMVTTEAETKSLITAIRAGATNYLTKPFTPLQLEEKIKECLGRGRV